MTNETQMIDTAFILAAGKGTRMAPLTDTQPKPLVQLNGKPLLDYVFDHLETANVKQTIVNTHHHADILHTYLKNRQTQYPDINIRTSDEPTLLETGGGLKHAAPLLGDKPFFMINGDAFWTDTQTTPALTQLERAFDADKMDILLLLVPVSRMKLTKGVGDYDIAPDGQIARNFEKNGTHMFTGIRIVHPRILDAMEDGIYSFLGEMDKAERNGKLYGIEHGGEWHHISTPEDIKSVENALR